MDEGRPYRHVEVIRGSRQRRSFTVEEKARIMLERAVAGANILEVVDTLYRRADEVTHPLLTARRRVPKALFESVSGQTLAGVSGRNCVGMATQRRSVGALCEMVTDRSMGGASTHDTGHIHATRSRRRNLL